MKAKPGKQAANAALPDRTAELEEKLRAETGKGPEDYVPADWVSMREQFRLHLLYPGRFVAFRDHHIGEGGARRLRLREVLCVSPSYRKVQHYLNQLPSDEIRGVFMQYVDRPIRKTKKRRPPQPGRPS
jgi:hypothetical protein